MKVPVSASKNLITGEMVFAYIEADEQTFLGALADLYNKAHPGETVCVGGVNVERWEP